MRTGIRGLTIIVYVWTRKIMFGSDQIQPGPGHNICTGLTGIIIGYYLIRIRDPGDESKDVLDIMEDRNKNLWVTTRDAIFKINDKRDVLRKYGADYGVHQNTFQFGDNFVSE